MFYYSKCLALSWKCVLLEFAFVPCQWRLSLDELLAHSTHLKPALTKTKLFAAVCAPVLRANACAAAQNARHQALVTLLRDYAKDGGGFSKSNKKRLRQLQPRWVIPASQIQLSAAPTLSLFGSVLKRRPRTFLSPTLGVRILIQRAALHSAHINI
jgi:hypothetical protein